MLKILHGCLLATYLGAAVACGGGSSGELGGGGQGGTGQAGGTGGQAGGGTGGQAGSVAAGPDGFPSVCVEAPKLEAAGAAVAFEIDPRLHDQPLEFGEPNTLTAGGTLMPTNLRFYLSGFVFSKGSDRVPGTPVGADGKPMPYGVQLVNLEDAASLQFRVSVPPGTYDKVSFLLGLTAACNDTFAPLKPPLDQASQLKWPHTLGFLFLRFEGKLEGAAEDAVPTEIHMGAGSGENPYAPTITLSTPIAAQEGQARLRLSFALDEALRAAAMMTDLSDFSLPEPAPPGPIGEEILAGERVRRNAAAVKMFSILP